MAGIFGLLMSGAGVIKDQYYNLTSLLLPGNGTDGKQNRTFLDSSGQNGGAGWTITPNGNATQGTFSPFSQTGWGGYFSAVSNYIRSTSNVSSITGDFTIECWVYWSASTGSKIITALSADSIDFWINAPTGTISYYTGAATRITTTLTASQNDWTHIALVRSSGVTTIYIDGIADSATYTSSATIGSGSEFLYIGRDSGTSFIAGYISNFRLVVGRAVYTSNFTPSITPLGNTTGGQNPPQGTETKLLTLQSNRFVDNASSGLGISVVGSPSVTPFSPFAPTQSYSASAVGGSGYFDGTGDYLDVANNAALQLGTSDFTLETWAYLIDQAGTKNHMAVSKQNYYLYYQEFDSKWVFETNLGSISSSSTWPMSTWQHVAATRSGNTFTLWVNGTSQGTLTNSGSVTDAGGLMNIGRNVANADNYVLGYLSNTRLVKGTAVYTSAFTPPTAPLTAVSGTSLLLNFTNAGVVDATAKNVLETVGNAQISTTQSKWGGGSMYFDGTANTGLKIAVGSLSNFDNGNFTIEFWVKFNSVAANQLLFGLIGGTAGDRISFYMPSSGTLAYYLSSNGTSWDIASGVSFGTVSTSAGWYRVALVRNGNTFTPYLNTTAGTTTNSSASIRNAVTGSLLCIGGNLVGGGDNFNGYIDDVRITKGVARDMTVLPSAPFPIQ